MERRELGIAGAYVFELLAHEDARGSFTEAYRRDWVEGREAVQANLSISRPGVLRGLHWHRRQSDYWCVLSGIAHVRLVDLREGSPTRLAVVEHRIDTSSRRDGLALPPGVAHGFYAETEVVLLYLVDAYFSGDDEFGLAWDDSDAGVTWPTASPVLSERDRSNPSLAEVLRDPPA